jgi:hypothetical protein
MFMLGGRREERGISVVLGAALLMGIIIALFTAFLTEQIPGEIRKREHEHMKGIEESFRELRAAIADLEAGEFRSVDVNMGADYPSTPLAPTTTEVGTLSVTPSLAKTIRISPSDDAYVDNNLPSSIFGTENSLQVENWRDESKISFLKFSLENVPRGVTMLKAELWLYCSSFENVPNVRCHSVDNDDWDESTITWNNMPREDIGTVLDNLHVDGTGRLCWTAKDFVDQEVLGKENMWLSLGLMVKQENQDNNERSVSFHSKEAGVKKPYLEVMYTTGPPIWEQTNWAGGDTYPTLESDKWSDSYNRYYKGENENASAPGEIRLENLVPVAEPWTQKTKDDFELGSLENLDTSTSPDNVILRGDNTTFGNTNNNEAERPYADYTYIQRVDPGGQYAAPYNGVIIRWRWDTGGPTTDGARFKIFRHVGGTVWTLVGESNPVDLTGGLNVFNLDFSDYIPVKAGDRIGMYSGDDRTRYSNTSGYYVSRTGGDISGTSSFTEHTNPRRLPIDATLKYFRYSGTLTSCVWDTGGFETNWRKISWDETLPPGTDITFKIRTGDTEVPDNENWSDWSYDNYTNPAGEIIMEPSGRYIQYKATFSTTDTAHTPILHKVKITYITSAQYKPSGYIESSVYDAGSSVDWQTITWEEETPSILSDNKPVNAEPDPLVDCSPLIGDNLSSLENAQAHDNIYENIAEELRRPWWNRSWALRRPVTVSNENNPSALENYQVKIVVDNADNMNENFNDLRFVDNDDATELSYWIENYNPSENAAVWVKVPNIPADDIKTIYMYYGNPCASPASDFSTTFPNALIIDGTSTTLGGFQELDWVEIKNGGTLNVESENILELFARKIIIDSASSIDAIGRGYLGGPTNRQRGQQNNGTSYDGTPGTGGGTGGYALGSSHGPGGGGGGYAGSGGDGGGARGGNDYPGAGGSTFGSASDNSIYMGSGGGSGGLSRSAPEDNPWNAGGAGGAGGGGIRLNASIIDISGLVSSDGGDGAGGMGTSSNGNGGGGGGSGGTILIEGNKVLITGTLSAKGGTGGARSPNTTRGGAGGGGGGGRVKVFYDEILDNAGATYSVDGGDSGGPSYEPPVAQSGTPGTTHNENVSYLEPITSVGSEELESEAGGEQEYCLNWEHRITGVKEGYMSYTLHIWGYSDNDDENIGAYIWESRTDSWSFMGNLPKDAPGDPITFNIGRKKLNNYLVENSLLIGYFDNTADESRTIAHIDHCVLQCTGNFFTELEVKTRTGDTENAYDGSWDNWQKATNGGAVPSPDARYIQYRVELRRPKLSGKLSPVFKELTLTHVKETEYGIIGFSSGHVFYPDQAYVYEGGSVILTQGEVNLTVLEPMTIEVSDAEDNNIAVRVNFWIIENERATITSTGTRTIRVFCTDSSVTVFPVEGKPNRENVALRVSSPYADIWREYLKNKSDELEAMGVSASSDNNTLTLTIEGRSTTPGVDDIYYYEYVKEIEVELI